MKGKFYGVSVGPGEAELMTVKAVRAIKECDVLAVPRTRGSNTMALDIIKQIVDLADKEIIYLDFPMKRDVARSVHIGIADEICNVLDKGKSVAMPNIGDISIYSTFNYILDIIKQRNYQYEIIPGVPSFCAAAAKVGAPLTVKSKPLVIIPAGYGLEALDYDGSKVIMKSASELDNVIDKLKERGSEAFVVQSCGLENENITTLDGDINKDYFTTILVKD